jgi:hypothetical protein
MINLLVATSQGSLPNTNFTVLQVRAFDSLVTRARINMMAEFFVNGTSTHLLWIDSDIGFHHQDLRRMIDADLDVVAGIYPAKQSWLPDYIPAQTRQELLARYTTYPLDWPAPDAVITPGGFMEVNYAVTGFMLIKREVMVKMMAHYPELKCVPPTTVSDLAKRWAPYTYGLFDTMIDERGRYMSEDYAFCHRWRAMGGKVHADMHSKLTHQGVYLWVGDVMASLSSVLAGLGMPASASAAG